MKISSNRCICAYIFLVGRWKGGRLNGTVSVKLGEKFGESGGEEARALRNSGESRATLSGRDRGANRVSGGGKWAGNI